MLLPRWFHGAKKGWNEKACHRGRSSNDPLKKSEKKAAVERALKKQKEISSLQTPRRHHAFHLGVRRCVHMPSTPSSTPTRPSTRPCTLRRCRAYARHAVGASMCC